MPVYVTRATHFLADDGGLPDSDDTRVRKAALRVAGLIEAGGPLRVGQMRETLVACDRRIERKPCPGLLWVRKADDGRIHAWCFVCRRWEMWLSDWEDTEWAEGPMEAVPVDADRPSRHRLS
jgi:hypothetical protein